MSSPLIPTLRTPICDLLGCDVPIVLAGVGGVARSEFNTGGSSCAMI
jgi:nitronate monooxygenase